MPTLKWPRRMCEAEFANVGSLSDYIDFLHGQYRFYSTFLAAAYSQSPYLVTPTEKHMCVEHFAMVQQHVLSIPRNESYARSPDPNLQLKQFWDYLYETCRNDTGEIASNPSEAAIGAGINTASAGEADFQGSTMPEEAEESRSFHACVFCAMLHWTENLARLYIAGPKCTMQNPAAVAELLAADWYSEQWPLIPRAEIHASAVDFPYQCESGAWCNKKILLHKRRVTAEHLNGTEPVKVCTDCHEAFWKSRPKLSKWSLSNYNWLGRHLPIFRDATLGHQLLLALGRVVSTKVYLSSKGADMVARQHHQSWRKKFLQQGMSGTAIVYGNGSADDAMASFPPEESVLQDSFVAVFTGPESHVTLTPAEQEEQARAALRKEVELHVCRATYEEQAATLMKTNYVYEKHKKGYKPALAEKLPESSALPSCFEACAKFIPLASDAVDATRATGPGSATTAAHEEVEAAEKDAVELDKWLSVLEDDHQEIAEFTSLPALQGMLERMESMAGRIVANELMAVAETSGYGSFLFAMKLFV